MKFLGKSFTRGLLLACVSLFVCTAAASADYDQGFDSLADSGWTTESLGEWTNYSPWAQANLSPEASPPAFSGDRNSFVASWANYGDGAEGALGDWLISPSFSTLSNGDVVSFRMLANPSWFTSIGDEALELRLAHGATCSPGASPESVGDFTSRLLTLDPQVYRGPVTFQEVMSHSIRSRWSQHAAVVSGLPDGDSQGCIAIRRTSPVPYWYLGYLGIDDFSVREDAASPGDIAFLDNFSEEMSSPYSPYGLVRGRADTGASVSLYKNSTCTGAPFATASAGQFDWPGVTFELDEPNTPYTVSATSTNESGDVSDCFAEGVSYLRDTIAPVTSDDVGRPGVEYPAAVKLSAQDTGRGVAKTYFSVGVNPTTPTTSSSVYDPASPPTLSGGQRISYFSVDKSSNTEDVKTSEPAPAPAPKGSVAAAETKFSMVRPASGALNLRKGRVAITLYCEGGPAASSCSGTTSIVAAFGGKEALITPNPASFALPMGSTKVVTLTLSRAARKYAARRAGKSPWARVVMKSTGAGEHSFRRKLRL